MSIYLDLPGVRLYHGDIVATLADMEPASVNLIVTSPPYNVGIAYDGYADNRSCADYLAWCGEWLAACWRVLADDGRMCLNVPIDTAGGVPVSAHLTLLARQVGFRYRTTIVWNEGNISKGTAWGSYCSASSPHIIADAEHILVCCKRHWKRTTAGFSDITAQEFKRWTKGVWTFQGQRHAWHPAPFPAELPRRCIKLLSYVGDTVLDPFAGSGTTLVVARDLGRQAVGVEWSETYCRRAAEPFRQLRLDLAA